MGPKHFFPIPFFRRWLLILCIPRVEAKLLLSTEETREKPGLVLSSESSFSASFYSCLENNYWRRIPYSLAFNPSIFEWNFTFGNITFLWKNLKVLHFFGIPYHFLDWISELWVSPAQGSISFVHFFISFSSSAHIFCYSPATENWWRFFLLIYQN